MTMIADILLAAGALGAALYCYVLSRRLRRFTPGVQPAAVCRIRSAA